MARDMFRDVVDPSITVGSKRWYTVPLSIAAHVIGIGALLIVPLMASDILPTPQSMMTFVAPAPPPPPPAPPPPAAQTPRTPDPVQTDAAPTQASDSIKPEAPHPQPNYGVNVGGDPNFGVPGGVPDVKIPGPPPPPPPVKTVQDVPYRPGGDIKEPRKIKHVPPIYPPIAITAKMQGVVIIEATIAKDGTVKDARVLKSVPLLDQAAIDAVRQWRFTPTLLNNVPVEVLMTVTVNFTLGGGEQ
jgi:periplasmic protein TonB